TWRELHTLKGNSAIFGLSSLVKVCHELETAMQEEHRGLQPQERDALRTAWKTISSRITVLLGERDAGTVEITQSEHQEILSAIQSRTPHAQLAATVRSWTHEAMELR